MRSEQRSGSSRVRSGTDRTLIYVIGTYPLLTTTFIDREIRELRQLGVDVRVVAARRPPSSVPLSDEQRELQDVVTYLIPVRWLHLIVGHLFFAIRRPLRFFGTLLYLITRRHPSGKAQLKTLFHFSEGVYAAFLVRKTECHELHAHFADRAATIALVAGKLLGKPYSLSIHTGADVFVDPVLLPEKIRRARSVATCTSYNRAYVTKLVGESLGPKIRRIHHGLDLAAYRPAVPATAQPPLVLAVGQLTERKGLLQLVGACRILSDSGFTFRCEIVGDGPQRAELEAAIRSSALSRTVKICGALTHEQVLEKYRRASVFVLPCVRTKAGDVDGIPNVLAEAMASGVAVVSTDLPAIRELVLDGENGILVGPEDAEALADAMARLIEEPELRTRLGARGRATVQDMFDVETNVRMFATTMWPEWFK